MDPGATRPQENLSSRDKETSPTHSKYHDALNQPRELVPVKRGQVSIKRSGSDEKINELYNMCLPDSRSVDIDQPIKHSNDLPPWPHKPYLPTVRFYGMLPTKRKQASTKISKEELRRQYRHRPPPPINESPRAVICETDQPVKSCKTDHSGLSTAPYYEEINFENFGIKLSTRDPLAISKHKCAFQETLKKDTSGKSTMERDTLEHSHQSSYTSEINVQLHSENETVSTIEVHSPTRKDRNKLDVNMHEMDESGRNSEMDEERTLTQTVTTPVESKQSRSTDRGIIDINEVNSVECESMITYTHDQWRRCITGQKPVKTEDPESQMQDVDEKEAAIQPYPSSNDTKEQLENSDNGSSKRSHNHEETSDVVGDQDIHRDDESEPELPERGYLADIDFVVNELGTNLCTLSELPATAYQEKQKVSACNVGETLTLASEANGDPILNSDENSEDHSDAARSACNTDPFYHDQLHASNLDSSDSGDVYVNCPQLETQLTSVSQIRPNSDSQCLYQPLITSRQDAESQYNLAAFRPLNSAPSLQIEKAAKSQKIKQDIDTDTGATSCLHGRPILEGSTIYSNVSDALSNHYQPLASKKQDKDPVYVGLSDDPHQPRAMSTSKVSLSITCDEYEDLDVFMAKKASSTCQFKSKEKLRKLYRHRQPPKLPTITDSKDFQHMDTLESEAQYHGHECSSLVAQYHARLLEPTPEEWIALPAQSGSSTKAIQQGITYENVSKHSNIEQGSFVQKDQLLTSSVHKPLHSTADSNRYRYPSLGGAYSQGDYMPLIPKRQENKAYSKYETLGRF
jgi:hypothetical protein